ncbi:MAG: phosphoribosyltransferase [Candidatus Methanomethyliaceae archaeon]|nr:phosphoribosyltransferase [Candidatus Methanomethyliaceae archaeon]
MNILAVTWDDIQSSALTLANKISESGFYPEMIVGIARGGWVVARILSDLLDVRDLASVKIEFYKGVNDKERTPKITQPISESPKGKLVLIADDVADSGESLLLAKRHIEDQGARVTKIATIHLKPWSKVQPEYYVSLTDSWVMYPWEVRETVEHLINIWREETKDLTELRARLISTGISSILIDRYLNPKNQQG